MAKDTQRFEVPIAVTVYVETAIDVTEGRGRPSKSAKQAAASAALDLVSRKMGAAGNVAKATAGGADYSFGKKRYPIVVKER